MELLTHSNACRGFPLLLANTAQMRVLIIQFYQRQANGQSWMKKSYLQTMLHSKVNTEH